jgi:hypothetical protein
MAKWWHRYDYPIVKQCQYCGHVVAHICVIRMAFGWPHNGIVTAQYWHNNGQLTL